MSSIVSSLRWVAEHDASGWIVAAALGLYLLYYIARNTIRDNARDHGEIRKSVGKLDDQTKDLLTRIAFLEGFQKGANMRPNGEDNDQA